MTMMKTIPVALALLAFATPGVRAQAPAPAAAMDPIGMYDFVATLGIEARAGTIEIERNDAGDLVGEAWLEGEGDPAIIESVFVDGNHVDMFAFVNGSLPVTFALDFTDAVFSGTITAGDESIPVDGRRRLE